MFWLWLTSLQHPLMFNSAKLKVLKRFTEAPRNNFKFGGNSNYITLSLTDDIW